MLLVSACALSACSAKNGEENTDIQMLESSKAEINKEQEEDTFSDEKCIVLSELTGVEYCIYDVKIYDDWKVADISEEDMVPGFLQNFQEGIYGKGKTEFLLLDVVATRKQEPMLESSWIINLSSNYVKNRDEDEKEWDADTGRLVYFDKAVNDGDEDSYGIIGIGEDEVKQFKLGYLVAKNSVQKDEMCFVVDLDTYMKKSILISQ